MREFPQTPVVPPGDRDGLPDKTAAMWRGGIRGREPAVRTCHPGVPAPATPLASRVWTVQPKAWHTWPPSSPLTVLPGSKKYITSVDSVRVTVLSVGHTRYQGSHFRALISYLSLTAKASGLSFPEADRAHTKFPLGATRRALRAGRVFCYLVFVVGLSFSVIVDTKENETPPVLPI